MKYIELTIHTTTEASEIISDIMWNYTDYGVTICDRADIIALQTAKESTFWDYMDDELTEDKPSDVLVKCYVAEDIAAETVGAILRDNRMIELGQHREEIINAGFEGEVVEKIHAMIMRNEKKRYQFPPVLRLSSCAFGHERLMPLINKYGD